MLNKVGYLFANGPFPAINDWFMAKAQENWPLYREGRLPDHYVVALPWAPEKHGLLCLRQPFRTPAFDHFEPIPQDAWDRIIADHGAIGPDSIPKPYMLTCIRLPQELLPFTPQQFVDALRELRIQGADV